MYVNACMHVYMYVNMHACNHACMYLDNTQRGRAHGVGEITAGGRHRTNNRHSPVPRRVPEAVHPSRPLIKGREPSSQVGRIALVRWHFGKAPGNLAERFCPARGAVGHHADVHAHVSHVFGQCDARVDGCLARRHGHVGGVGHLCVVCAHACGCERMCVIMAAVNSALHARVCH